MHVIVRRALSDLKRKAAQPHSVPCIAIVLLAVALISPGEATAKPKIIVLNGCTVEQLQSRLGKSCASQADQDLIKGHGYRHELVCNGDEMQCCTKDNGTNRIINCRRSANTSRVMPHMHGLQQFGTVQSRGVDGEEMGEETPPPSWLTEAWLKEHGGEKEVE